MEETHTERMPASYFIEVNPPMRLEDAAIRLFQFYVGNNQEVPKYELCRYRRQCAWGTLDTVVDVFDRHPYDPLGKLLYEIGVANVSGDYSLVSENFVIKVWQADTAKLQAALKAFYADKRISVTHLTED